MGIEFLKGSNHCRIGHFLDVYRIDIILLNLLKDEVEFPPTVVVSVEFLC